MGGDVGVEEVVREVIVVCGKCGEWGCWLWVF